ncbi:MAG: 3-phosphoshikimate 1-carboxyvinyltransferase [Actinobacteria bacterium]|nr:3-phosphoshikimate 1-carboxyvinyltransferase [Actinomycetota bacterium]
MIFKKAAAPPPLRGTIRVPGDKSISHRALILSALAEGTSTVTGLNLGGDVLATASALGALGAKVTSAEGSTRATIASPGYDRLHEPSGVLDCGNSGTALRMLLGVCAAISGQSVLTGDETLRRRPMLRVVSPLRQMGARIDGRDHGNLAPLTVRGGELAGIDLETSVASAQVKTAVLLAGLAASGETTVIEPALSRDHTERMLGAAGVEVRRAGLAVSIIGGARPVAREWAVPGDPSAAIFLVLAALLVPGSSIEIENVCLNPTRIAGLEALAEMGGQVEMTPTGEASGEPVGTVTAAHSELHGIAVAPERVPDLIDEIPALCIAGALASGTTSFRGAAELRVKESDRIATMAAGLTALGVDVEEFPDGLAVTGGAALEGGEIDPHGDHRVAMSFAVGGLIARDKVRVLDWSCVETSFPRFLDVLGEAQAK